VLFEGFSASRCRGSVSIKWFECLGVVTSSSLARVYVMGGGGLFDTRYEMKPELRWIASNRVELETAQ
jgi:hypothetical protein